MEEEIKDFCRLGTNRYVFLKNYLEKRGIPNKTLKLGHTNNILIRFVPERYGRVSSDNEFVKYVITVRYELDHSHWQV